MARGNGEGERAGTSEARKASPRPTTGSPKRPPKATDLPPLRSWSGRRPWLPWAFVAFCGLIIVAMTLNALDFSRRQQLLERRLDIAIDQRDELQEEIDAQVGFESTTVTSTTVSPGFADEVLITSRERDVAEREGEIEALVAELDAREAELDAREAGLDAGTGSTVPGPTAQAFASGVFRVGTDIAAGTYRTMAPAGCRYQKLSADDRVLFSDERTEAGPVTVDIGPEVDRFDSNGCGVWSSLG